MKRTLRCRHYVRYVDDVILLDTEPDTLRRWREAIAAFLAERLKLRLREREAEPQRVSGGVDFVGWETFWNHRRPRRRTLANCEARLQARYVSRAVRAGFAVVEVGEFEPGWGGCALRRVECVWVPAGSGGRA